jgi:hypothetical protein
VSGAPEAVDLALEVGAQIDLALRVFSEAGDFQPGGGGDVLDTE